MKNTYEDEDLFLSTDAPGLLSKKVIEIAFSDLLCGRDLEDILRRHFQDMSWEEYADKVPFIDLPTWKVILKGVVK